MDRSLSNTPPGPSRVVVTSLGLVTAAGAGVDASWDRLMAGRTCVGPIRTFDATVLPGTQGAELLDLPTAGEPGDDRTIRMLLAAGEEVGRELVPRLAGDAAARRRTAVVLGTSQGVLLGMAPVHRRMRRGEGRLSDDEVELFRTYRPGYGTRRLAEALGAEGPRTTLGMVCVSSAMAVLHGASLIRSGAADRAVVGGFEGFSPFIHTGFFCIGALTRTVCRPFDKRRDGTVLGEGAALLLLESEEAAIERGARPLALLEGGGFAADGVHMTAPDREGRGLQRAIDQALRESGAAPGTIDYVNAHGTATAYNDSMECCAMDRVFGGEPPPMSSLKSTFGHTLGAAGGLDAVISIRAMAEQTIPPTVNGGEEPEREGWDFVPSHSRPAPGLRRVLSTNAAMGGNNTALLLRMWEG